MHRIVGVALEHCDAQQALKYPRQATFHPLKYLRGLAKEVATHEGEFYAGTTVTEIAENEDGTITVKCGGGVVTAKAAVVATNSPISNLFALHTKMAPYRSYAMAFEIKVGALPDALYWDTLDPYHYVRLQPGDQQKDYVIVGGGDHKSGEADDAHCVSTPWAPGPAILFRHWVRRRIVGLVSCSKQSTTPHSSAAIQATKISMCIRATPARNHAWRGRQPSQFGSYFGKEDQMGRRLRSRA